MTQPNLLEAVEFAENPEPRCPCILLLDTSGSMAGEPIAALARGLETFREHLVKDTLASRRVEVAVITFNSEVTLASDFVTADNFVPPALVPQYQTFMGSAINFALDTAQQRKEVYKRNSAAYYRPWIFMITDGAPQGEHESVVAQATARLREAEAGKKVAFFAVGVEGADMNRLAAISPRQPVKLTGLNFVEMFVWLSASMQKVSQSNPDDQVALPPAGWTTV